MREEEKGECDIDRGMVSDKRENIQWAISNYFIYLI